MLEIFSVIQEIYSKKLCILLVYQDKTMSFCLIIVVVSAGFVFSMRIGLNSFEHVSHETITDRNVVSVLDINYTKHKYIRVLIFITN